MTVPSRAARETRVDSRQLRKHVVRVDHPDGRLLGSGFFVAPGWVLTAAHVVYDRRAGAPLTTVSVTPASPDVGIEAVPADVVARSDPPPPGRTLWPFPDMALLDLRRTQPWVGTHPCVWLADGEPWGRECHAFGYPVLEEGVPPPGGPARFTFEGATGEGFLQLMSAQAAPGLSGAPLVCPVRRAVVGVVSATRDRRTDMGGWAGPVGALLSELPGVPEALAARFREVARLGAGAVLADRARWHRVFPIDGADQALHRPWDDFVRQRGSLPAEMLLADSGVVPYLFRDADLDHAQRWCEQPAAMEVWRLAGLGGAGKTRHAIELCSRMARRDWLVGLWPGPAPDGGFDVAEVPLPRLIVVDYVEAIAADTLRVLLDRLRVHATRLAPVRVVLLARTAAGGADVLREIGKDAGAALRTVLNSTGDPEAVRGISVDQRRELYEAAVLAFRRAWQVEEPAAAVAAPDLTGDRYELPLEVLLEAFDHALSGAVPASNRPPVDRALRHEERHWNATAPATLPEPERRAAVALATLAGADDDERAEALLAVLPALAAAEAVTVRRQTVRWLARLYTGPDRINPLRPDRLGEALVANTLAEQDDGGADLLRAVLALPDDAQVARSLDLLARLAATDPTAAGTVAAVLAGLHRDLVERAEREAHGSADRPGRLDLAIGLQRLLAGDLATRVEEVARRASRVDQAVFELSTTYGRIGDLARQSGQSERAEALYRKGLAIRERLSWAAPGDTHLARELSISYNKLADLARRSGQADEARTLYTKGLEIRERLAGADPQDSVFARDLAISYDKLGDLARDFGQGQQTERLYGQGLAIRERLAEADAANSTFARDLTISYDKLGDLAVETGRAEEAARLYERGLVIRERLSRERPDNTTFARDLSNSCDRLGDLAVDADQLADGQRRYEQALVIRQRLARDEPANTTFARDVSVSYSKLGVLAAKDGRFREAEALYERGLAIVERLRETEPRNTTFARDVSVFYTELGELAAERGDFSRAERLYQQGRGQAQRLLAAEPENTTFARDVADLCERLGELLLGEGGGALIRAETLLSAAVQFRRTLHARQPERVDLAEELAGALLLLAGAAEAAPAARALTEAIDALAPHEAAGVLTQAGIRLLRQARDDRDLTIT